MKMKKGSSKKSSKFYTSPGSGSQGKTSGRNKFYMSEGSGSQGKVGSQKHAFKTANNSPETKK